MAALQLFENITPSKDSNAKWARKKAEEVLWGEFSENITHLFKKKEAKKEVLFRTQVESDLEDMLFTSDKPSESFLLDTLKSLIKIQRNGTSLETTFSRLYLNRSLCVARHLKAVGVHEYSDLPKQRKGSKKKEKATSPMVSIAIKTGLAFFLNLLKRSTRIVGAEDLLTDMLESMNEILLSFEPLALYNNPPPEIGEQSLDKASQFIHSCVDGNVCEENKVLATNLMCNLALQRGTLTSLLKFISFLLHQDINFEISIEGFKPLLNYLINRRKEIIELFKKVKEKENEEQEKTEIEEDNIENEEKKNEENEENEENDKQSEDNVKIILASDNDDDKKEEDSDDKKEEKINNTSEDNDKEGFFDENKELVELLKIYDNQDTENNDNNNNNISIKNLILLIFGLIKDISFALVTPLQSSKPVKVRELANTIRSIEDVQVFAIGENNYSQLDGLASAPSSQRSYNSMNAIQIEAGSECAFILDSEGVIWARGKGDYGRLGTGSSVNASTFSQISFNVSIVKFAVSKESYGHGLAIDESGIIWSWGDGDYGKLGHGDTDQCPTPRKISALQDHQIISVSCGNTFSACITSEGFCYTWGSQAIGTGSSESSLPQQVSIENCILESAHCGRTHMFVIGDHGNSVYGWGNNSSGQVGVPITADTMMPCRIESFDNIGVVQIECEEDRSMALTKSGDVYEWGALATRTDHELVLIDGLSNVISIGCYSNTSYAVDHSCTVYEWGGMEPVRPIDFFDGKEIKQINASSSQIYFHNIPPSFVEKFTASVPPVLTSPFIIEIKKHSFLVLQDIINNLHFDEENQKFKEQSYMLECSLYILRANLYHLRATCIDYSDFDLFTIRKILFYILNANFYPCSITKICRIIFEESWEILLPSLEMQSEILTSLLPSSEDKMNEFNETESFLLDVIVRALTKSTDFAKILDLNVQNIDKKEKEKKNQSKDKDKNNNNTNDDDDDKEEIIQLENSKLWKILKQIIDFLNFVTLKAIHDDDRIIFNRVYQPLISLLCYFNERIISHLLNDSKKLSLITNEYLNYLFNHSICNILSEIIVKYNDNTPLSNDDCISLLEILKKSYFGTLLPYCVTSLHFYKNDLSSIQFIQILNLLDNINSNLFSSLLQQFEDEEFSNNTDEIETSSSLSFFIDLERMIGSLIGENYSRYIITDSSSFPKEYKKILKSPIFHGGLINTAANDDGNDNDDDQNHNNNDQNNNQNQNHFIHPLLIDLNNESDDCFPLYDKIEQIAREKLLLNDSENYPPLKTLVCSYASVMIKFLNLIPIAQKINDSTLTAISQIPQKFIKMVESIYLSREEILRDLTALYPELSTSKQNENEEDYLKLEQFCIPFIERARFLLFRVAIPSNEKNNNDNSLFLSSFQDLRASAPTTFNVKDIHELNRDHDDDDNNE